MRGPAHKWSERAASTTCAKLTSTTCAEISSWGVGPLPPWYTREATPSGKAALKAPPARSMSRRDCYQADVSAQETLPAQDARLSHPYGDAWRAPGAQGAAPQGSQAPDAGSDTMNGRHRLPGRRRIAAVRAAGSEARSGPVRVRAMPGETAVSRVAFAVPGAGGAVSRNRARRRLRAAIAPVLVAHPGLDLLVSLPGSASEMPFAGLRAALSEAITSVSGSSGASTRT